MERLRTSPERASGQVRRQQRIDAGLTLRQAAELLGVHPTDLSQMEQGIRTPTPEFAALMADVYGLDCKQGG